MTDYVYIIQAGNKKSSPIKIGMSSNPEARLKQLQTGNPSILRLLMTIECNDRKHARNLEKTLHQMLAGQGVLNEWFSCARTKVVKTLNRIAKGEKASNIVEYEGLFSEGRSRAHEISSNPRVKLLHKKVKQLKRYIKDNELIIAEKMDKEHDLVLEGQLKLGEVIAKTKRKNKNKGRFRIGEGRLMNEIQLTAKNKRAKEERAVMREMLGELGVHHSQINDTIKEKIGSRADYIKKNIQSIREHIPISATNDELVSAMLGEETKSN